MLLAEVVKASATIASSRGRNDKLAAMTSVLEALGPDELEIGLALLAGHPPQDRLEIGWATLSAIDVPRASPHPGLTLADVDEAFERIAGEGGPGAGSRREETLVDLLARATADEQDFLRHVIQRTVRKGAGRGLLLRAVADLAGIDRGELQRAVAVASDLPRVARVALRDGVAALEAIDVTTGTPVEPMLADSAGSVEAAVVGPTIVEQKLDGIRIQLHRQGEDVRIFTRNGNDVTDRLPEVVAVADGLPWDPVILDGEAILLDESGRPLMFQESMQRSGPSTVKPSTNPR
ncbi:MAG: hypothetical protein R3249_02410 [Nitriliruptorales bacterium]|nr:hypothetical protein [Nitriliruptorales bacterium]